MGTAITVVRPGSVGGGAGRRGDARVGLERRVVAVGPVVDEVQQRVDAVGQPVADELGDIAVSGKYVGDAELAQERLGLGYPPIYPA